MNSKSHYDTIKRLVNLETRQADLERRIADLEKAATNQLPSWFKDWTDTSNRPSMGCRVCGMGANGEWPSHYVCFNNECPSRVTYTSGPPAIALGLVTHQIPGMPNTIFDGSAAPDQPTFSSAADIAQGT